MKKFIISVLISAITLTIPTGVLANTTASNSDISKITYERIYGNDAYDTAIAVADRLASPSELNNGGQFEAIVLASGNSWQDAIVGAPLAVYKKAAILLTDLTPDMATSQKTFAYIDAHLAKTKDIYILGGEVIIPPSFVDKLISMGYSAENIHRIGGYDAAETSLLIAQEYPNNTFMINFVGTDNFADALSTGDSAYWGWPTLLVNSEGLSDAQAKFADKFVKRVAIGGIADTVKTYYAGDKNFTIQKGVSVYDTNGITSQWYARNPILFISSGESFSDGLTGTVLAARHRGYMLLTNPQTVLPETAVALNHIAYEEHNPTWRITPESKMWGHVIIFGGSGAIPDSTVTEIRQILASDGINAGYR